LTIGGVATGSATDGGAGVTAWGTLTDGGGAGIVSAPTGSSSDAMPGEERFERDRGRDIHRIVRDDFFERGERFGRGREGATRIELERAGKPIAQRRRDRLLFAEGRSLPRLVEQRAKPVRELFGLDGTPEHQRERDEADAGDVRTMIEPRQPGTGRQRNPEILPETVATELQLLHRSGQHMLHNHQPRVWRDDEAFGRDEPVRNLARVLVE
jgi:hypothetical protein